jgi:hypothetical protein
MNIRTGILATCTAVLLAPLATLAADTTTKAAPEAKPKTAVAEQCQQLTGSRIRPSKTDSPKTNTCKQSSNALRSYSSEDLQSTGETNLAEALRKLDPTFY